MYTHEVHERKRGRRRKVEEERRDGWSAHWCSLFSSGFMDFIIVGGGWLHRVTRIATLRRMAERTDTGLVAGCAKGEAV